MKTLFYRPISIILAVMLIAGMFAALPMTASAEDGIKYVTDCGYEEVMPYIDYTELTGNETELTDTCYVASGELNYDTLNIANGVDIIVTDGATLNIGKLTGDDRSGVTFLAQINNTGVVNITDSIDTDGQVSFCGCTINVPDSMIKSKGILEIKNCVLNAPKGIDTGIIFVEDTYLTDNVSSLAKVNAGPVCADRFYMCDGRLNIGALTVTGDQGFHISGGTLNTESVTVTKSAEIAGGRLNIPSFTADSITLSSKNITDSINVGRFTTSDNKVTIADGKSVKDEDGNILTGEITADDSGAYPSLDGKTISGYNAPSEGSLTYIDEAGLEETPADYTKITGDETELRETCYVVASNFAFGDLTIKRDVCLILLDDSNFIVDSITGEGSLVIFAQDRNTGSITVDSKIDVSGALCFYGGNYSWDFATVNSGSGTSVIKNSNINAFQGIHAPTLTVTDSKISIYGIYPTTLTVNDGSDITVTDLDIGDGGLYMNGGTINIADRGALRNGGPIMMTGGSILGHQNVEGHKTSVITGGNIDAKQLQFDNGLTLGWTNLTDSYTADRFEVYPYHIDIVDGQSFKDNQGNIYTGTINADDMDRFSMLDGQTLTPYVNATEPELNISKVKVSAVGSKTYTGKAIRPTVKVTYEGNTLKNGTHYTLSYKNNKNVGKASIIIKGKGVFTGTKTVYFKIVKAANPMEVKASAKTVKYSSLKKAKVTVKAISVQKAVGKVSFKKTSGKSFFTVNTKTGKITIKKGTAKGTYTFKVKVTAAGSSNYKSISKTVTVKIKVK